MVCCIGVVDKLIYAVDFEINVFVDLKLVEVDLEPRNAVAVVADEG